LRSDSAIVFGMKLVHRNLREERSSFGEYACATTSPDYIQQSLKEFVDEMDDLKKWAETNERSARWDKTNFWFLKLPAILVSASAATLAYY
jgi:hypothetical protein